MRTRNAVIGVCLLALVGTALYYRLQPADSQAKKAAPEQAVSIVLAQLRDVPVQIEVNGTVASLKTVEVRAQTSNLIQKIHVKEGQFVREGQVLFSLDDRADRANLDKLKAQLERDRALLADLERQYRRAQDLKTQNYISQSAADTTYAQREAQVALVKSDEAAVAAAQVTLDYDTIRAPLSGRLGAINVFAGTLVQPNTAVLVTVTLLDPISVQFTVPESSLHYLQQALNTPANRPNVRVRVPTTNKDLMGRLYFVDNLVDVSTGTIKAKAQFANPRQMLWPGQFVQTRIELATLKDAVTIPAAAVITSLSGKFVYVLQDDQTVQSRPISVRHVQGDIMAVDGLAAGDRVVTEGKQNLRAGSKVRLLGAPGADGSAPGGKARESGAKAAADAGKP